MAEFICKLGTPGGEIVARTVEGLSEKELRQRLAQEGYRIFSVETSGMINGVRVRAAGEQALKIKLDDFLLFNQQLAALIHAGLPVLQSIQMLRQRSPNPKLRVALSDVEARIKSGSALSEALAAQGETFPKIYTASILAGERSGNLDDVLRRYVEYTKALAQLRRDRGALTYPIILLCSAFILIAILTTFVIPQFFALRQHRRGTAPDHGLRRHSFVGRQGEYLLASAGALDRGAPRSFMEEDRERAADDRRWVLKIPVVGDLIKQLTMAQFSRSMGTLLRGGITVVESFQIAPIDRQPRTSARLSPRSKIREGKPFTESLAAAGWAPELAIDMMGVGERSGRCARCSTRSPDSMTRRPKRSSDS